MFLRRLGTSSAGGALPCRSTFACPDIWEMNDGDFAIIGTDITEHADKLPPSTGCGPDERMIRVPRRLLVLAKTDIPDKL